MKIVRVEPLGDFNLLITFQDGQQRIFHGRDLWKAKKRFLPLKDLAFFNKAEIYECEHTIGWPLDDIQISPEWLVKWSEPIRSVRIA